MRLIRIKAVTKKEFIQIRRDPLSLAMAFLMPAILLFIYGYAVTFDVDRITTVVYDMDKSSISRELTDQLSQSGYFTIVAYLDRYEQIDTCLDRGNAKVAIASYQAVRLQANARISLLMSQRVRHAPSATHASPVCFVMPRRTTFARRRTWYPWAVRAATPAPNASEVIAILRPIGARPIRQMEPHAT